MKPFIPQKISQWLLPTVLILFVLEVLTLPLVLEFTYAGRPEGPEHILTYTPGTLLWDEKTGIDEYGVARLSLFSAVYDGAESVDGDKIIAPGTEGFNILRLKNDSESTITFTAVLYRIRTDERVPVEVSLVGENLTDTDSYDLPHDVAESDILRAVNGRLPAEQIQDFDISWLWQYDVGTEQDTVDTLLGDKDELDNFTVGVYILVEDNGQVTPPGLPQTGDESHIAMYLTFMGISFIMLLLLFLDRRREEKQKT